MYVEEVVTITQPTVPEVIPAVSAKEEIGCLGELA